MRYKAVFTDEFLSYFRLDDNGKTLVLTDRQGNTRAVTLEVEAEPKRGKWVDVMTEEWCTFDECKCSVCGVVEYFNKGWKKFSYCPNCGSFMGEEDEQSNRSDD